MKKKYLSVLMGDLISSRKQDLTSLHKKFNKEIAHFNLKHSDKILSPMTITLGDEFQAITSTLVDSYTIANSIRSELIAEGIGMRLVIGDISLRTPLNKKNSWNMMGEGLPEARDALNDKGRESAYHFTLRPEYKTYQSLLNTLGAALTDIEESWTKGQVLFFHTYLKYSDLTKEQIAHKLNISRNTLYKRLRALNYNLYIKIDESIKSCLKDIQ